MARTKTAPVPEVGREAPEFNLPSAQGGQLKLSMRTARGPVILVFYGDDDEGDARFFEGLARVEDEVNMAGGTIVGIGVSEPGEAREFVRKTGLKSYVLYDYARAASRDYGLLEKDKKRGEHARAAAFVVDGDHKIAHAWIGERPEPGDLLAKISEITGLPKPAEETEAAEGDAGAANAPKKAPEKPPAEPGDAAEKPKKMSAEERERIKAERRAARAEGKPLKQPADKPSGDGAEAETGGDERPKKMSAEERERIKAERRAARAEGRSLKQPVGDGTQGEGEAPERKKPSPEEREKRRAERRAAREAEGETAKPEAGGEAKGDVGGEAGGEA